MAFVIYTLSIVSFIYFVALREKKSSKEEMEDGLKFLYSTFCEGESATVESLAGKLEISCREARKLLEKMGKKELVEMYRGKIELTIPGKALGLHLLRAHRLWERYLSDYTDVPLAKLHNLAEKREHSLGQEELAKLEATLGYPLHDPHGDPIPNHRGEVDSAERTPLNDWPANQKCQILHIEDEPEEVMIQLLGKGLLPGTALEILEKHPGSLSLKVDNQTIWISTLEAENLHVGPWKDSETAGTFQSLADLKQGQKGKVVALGPEIRGLIRRRLLDLGFTKGAEIEGLFQSAFGRGNPSAYRIRGTVIALRKGESENIYITLEENHGPAVEDSAQKLL